jgi:RimJ/RimL family protein N-acetyltransferase
MSDLTVFELDQGNFDVAEGLFAAAWFDRPQIEAAFEGRQPARLFVDRLPVPTAALLRHGYEYYVVGSAEAISLRRFIAEAPAEADVFADFYGYAPAGVEWEQAIQVDYGGRLERIGRRQFHYRAATAPAYALPPGYTLCRVDVEMAERLDTELNEHVTATWASYAGFAATGLGYCVMAGEEPASAAFPASVSARWADVSVITALPFRRQGLAQAACAAYIEQALALGLILVWDTDDVNVPSGELALKLGFMEKAPFCELAMPDRQPLPLSRGRWWRDDRPVPGWLGAKCWQRNNASTNI